MIEDLDDNDLVIIDVPAWTPDDDLDEDDDYAARFDLEHASVLGDIAADLDDEDGVMACETTRAITRPALHLVRCGRTGGLPPAVRDLGLIA